MRDLLETLRNGLVHVQPGNLESKTVFSVLTGVRDLRYFLDVLPRTALGA
jgi:hypothetical protein